MLKPKHFYQKESFRIGLIVVGLFLWFFISFRHEFSVVWQPVASILGIFKNQAEPPQPISPQFFHALIILLANALAFLFFWYLTLNLATLYVLPVNNFGEQRQILRRMLDYVSFQHGPAVFVREGQQYASAAELLRGGRGVVQVDLNSAVILETQSPHPTARVEGGGIVFTRGNEKIRGVADLRPQLRLRKDVQALTRNGIEITTDVSTIFTLGAPAEVLFVTYDGEFSPANLRVVYTVNKYISAEDSVGALRQARVVSQLVDELDQVDQDEIYRAISAIDPESTPASLYSGSDQSVTGTYILDQQRVFAALYSQAKDAYKDTYSNWTDLPASVAADVLREMLAELNYDDLYNPKQSGRFPLKDFKTRFAHAVRNLGVLDYQFVIRRDGQLIQPGQVWDANQLISYPVMELHQPKVLRARGIKLIHAGFSELKPDNPSVRLRFLENWRARWARDAEILRAQNELQAMRTINSARKLALQEMTRKLSGLLEDTPLSQEALAIQLYEALETAATEPNTRKLLPTDTIRLLTSMRDWLMPPPAKPAAAAATQRVSKKHSSTGKEPEGGST
jgi:regulator of protease activity HflC (stomatin/prohibitin superfamily)